MAPIIQFIIEHQVLMAMLGVDLLNMLVAVFPKFQANSIIHWFLQQFAAILAKKPTENK